MFNSDKSGHITAYLNGEPVHDASFTWSAWETDYIGGTKYTYFRLTGTDTSSLDGDHQITDVSSTSFKLKGYLAFGMPSETTWRRQP